MPLVCFQTREYQFRFIGDSIFLRGKDCSLAYISAGLDNLCGLERLYIVKISFYRSGKKWWWSSEGFRSCFKFPPLWSAPWPRPSSVLSQGQGMCCFSPPREVNKHGLGWASALPEKYVSNWVIGSKHICPAVCWQPVWLTQVRVSLVLKNMKFCVEKCNGNAVAGGILALALLLLNLLYLMHGHNICYIIMFLCSANFVLFSLFKSLCAKSLTCIHANIIISVLPNIL